LKPACLHPATYHFNAQAALAARDVLDIPLVYEVRGFLEDTWLSAQTNDDAVERDYYKWSREAETRSMQASDHIVTLSETMRHELITRGITHSKITVVPNAVDDTQFSPGASSTALLAKYGISPHNFVVGYVGSFVDYEGISILLKAVAQLRTIRPDVHVLCVGDGPDFGKLRHTAQKLGIDQATTFSGRIAHDGIVEHYRLLNVFVVPRRNLRVCQLVTPMKPIEAMACGIPLVTSTLPPLTELSCGGAAGPSFGPEDPEDLAVTLDRLLNNPAARQQYGRAGRRLVQEHYTWARNASRYRELYENLGVTEPSARRWSVEG
jgi:glycosyltransferase involved in cell wall biosynthesis